MYPNSYDSLKEKVKYSLTNAPYISSKGIRALIGERSKYCRRSIQIMKELTQEYPQEYLFIPYWRGHHPTIIVHREVLIENETILNHFVEVLKNRCYGGTL